MSVSKYKLTEVNVVSEDSSSIHVTMFKESGQLQVGVSEFISNTGLLHFKSVCSMSAIKLMSPD